MTAGLYAAAALLRRSAGRLAGSLTNTSIRRSACPLGYVPALDGIRGCLAIAVLGGHTRIDVFSGVSICMDVFFVMSGYLITALLIAEHSKYGKLNLLRFYYRRFMRLYPALCAMLITLVVLSLLFSDSVRLYLVEAAVGFTYTTNYYVVFYDTNIYHTLHLWSLAMEEQFYLAWPILLSLMLRRTGVSSAAVKMTLLLAGVIAVGRMLLTYKGVWAVHLYMTFHTHADSLLVGCALATLLRLVNLGDYPRLSAALAWSLPPLSLAWLFALFSLGHLAPSYFYGWSLVAALGSAVAVAALVQPRRTIVHVILEHPVIVSCGRASYGLYVWHLPVFYLVIHGTQMPFAVRVAVAWLLSFVLAAASYRLIERRHMGRRAFAETASPPAAAPAASAA